MFVNVHIQYLLCFKNTIANVQLISPVFPFKMSSCQSMAKQQMGSVEFQYLPKRQSLPSLKRVAGCSSAALLTSFSCYTLWVDVSLKSHETQYENFSVKNCGLVAFLNIQIVVVLFKKTELFKNEFIMLKKCKGSHKQIWTLIFLCGFEPSPQMFDDSCFQWLLFRHFVLIYRQIFSIFVTIQCLI